MTQNSRNNGNGKAVAQQSEIHQQTRHTPVAIHKGMNEDKTLMQRSRQLYWVQLLLVVIVPFNKFLHLSRNLRYCRYRITAAADINLYVTIFSCLFGIYLLIEQAMKSYNVLFFKTFLFGNLVDIVVGLGMTYCLVMVAQGLTLN